MNINFPAIALLISTTVFAQGVSADEVQKRLQSFIKDVTSFTSDFEQSLYSGSGEVLQSNSGTAYLKRPGKLIWEYKGDDAQQIIADGKNIWMYDKELAQVTVNPLDERVNGTPLVVLMGTADLDEQFEMKTLEQVEGIDWVKLTPKDAGADFEALYIGLKGEALAGMELRDSFGQATQIIFSDFKPNVAISDDEFMFIPPAGVDVIGEALY